MGGMVSRAGKRVSRRFNIENRAQDAIDKIKTDPVSKMAPKHESTKKLLKDFQQEHPELLEMQRTKNEPLHDRLKGMEVKPDKVAEIGEGPRKLPMDRESRWDPDFKAPKIPMGRCSVEQAITFIGKHQNDREKVTAQTIASEYTLDPERVEHILKSYRLYQMHIPKDADESESKIHFGQTFLPPKKK